MLIFNETSLCEMLAKVVFPFYSNFRPLKYMSKEHDSKTNP